MYSSPKILVCVALVFATTAAVSGRNQRSNLIDLGTSILLPWESLNNVGQRDTIYNTNSEILRVKNIGNQNLNVRNELQQRLRELGRISNEYGSRKQNLGQASDISDSLLNLQRQYSNGYGQNGLKRQNGYAGLSSYSTFSSNPSLEQDEDLRARQRQSQYLDQARNYQLARQNLGGDEARQLNKLSALGIQSYGNIIQDQRSAVASNDAGIKSQAADNVNYNRLNQLSNLGLWRGNGQQKTLYGRPIRLNSLRQANAQSYEVINQQSNQAPLEQENIQQTYPIAAQQQNYGDIRGRDLNALRTLKNQQLYRSLRPILQEAQPVDARIVEQPINDALYAQGASAQTGDIVQYIPASQAENANPETLVDSYQPQYQVGVNQQQQNVYSYGELSAKIWNVIRSNPAMISNLENLREQLQTDSAPENEQMGQLKALLQKARQYNRNIQISGNGIVAQTPEEQERNAVVANLIDAISKNEGVSDLSGARNRYVYGGWGA